MELPTTYQAVVREDLKAEKVGVKTYPMPKDVPKDHVLIKVAYAPMNPSDWLYLANQYGTEGSMTAPPCVIGMEGSGTVVKVGEGVDASLVDSKCGFSINKAEVDFYGSWSEYSVVHKMSIIPFPKDTPLEDIPSVFVNPATVFSMGEEFDAEKGGVALFNAGGSSLCRMAVRYFKTRNVKTIMIVRRDQHVEELKAIGADWVLNSKSEGFSNSLKEVIEEAKPRIFFDAVAGPDAMEIFNLMPDESILYNYGVLSGQGFSGVSPVDLIFRNKSVR